MAWNFTEQANREIPHFHRFGTLPIILGEFPETTMHQRIVIYELLLIEKIPNQSKTFSQEPSTSTTEMTERFARSTPTDMYGSTVALTVVEKVLFNPSILQ